jgi:peptidoglycan lytic transglycosylase G
MIEDLDLAWEDQHEPRRSRRGGPPSRQARQRRRRERKRRRRSFGALFVSVLLLASLGAGVYWGLGRVQDYFGAPDYTSNPAATAVNVTVHKGDTSTDIAHELFNKKVVKSVKAFIHAAAVEPRSITIQPGTYQLFEQMPAKTALAMLLDPNKNLVGNRVTIPEGKTLIDTFQILSKATGIAVAEFDKAAPAAMKKIPDYWFTRDAGKPVIRSLEGFLFPDTYRFDESMTAQQIEEMMIDQFLTVAGDIKFTDTVESNLGGVTPFEALTVASLAQVEAFHDEDMGKIARVAYNRAFKPSFACGCLQFDVTANYWLQKQGKPMKPSKDLLATELDDPKNPYNTVSKKGIPPGPISNPGKAALLGAMSPPAGNWFYFVAVDKAGTTKFATTDAEFQKIKLEACRNGVVAC